MFCYSYNTACDKNGFILGNHVSAGNVHDSQNFEHIFKQVIQRFSNVETVSADAGYVSPFITKLMFDHGIRPVLPYKRPMTKKGFFRKYEYVYDEHLDIYICPAGKELTYSTTNREGYKEYKSCSYTCKSCEFLSHCTESKDSQKVVTRHVWSEYLEEANHLRHTNFNRKTYSLRSQTIERVFADAKEKHGMRSTKYRGLGKVKDHAMLLFACMNLKKMASWRWKKTAGKRLFLFFEHIMRLLTKETAYHPRMTCRLSSV